jgi:aspartyl/asparaginyl-tRNA synthetase
MPVKVTVNGVDTYLADSMQFALEYGCRITRNGCYNIMPSFRAELPNKTHLSQFTHSETEIIGSLDVMIPYAEGYIRALASQILNQLEERLAAARGDVSHLHRMAARKSGFEQISFAEAVRLIGDEEGSIRYSDSGRSLTRKGESLLMERVGEVFWIRNFDVLSVPFYQAFNDGDYKVANNADLYFGVGEIIGSGERHLSVDQLRRSMYMHNVIESEYEWYIRMHDEFPMQTSGFGMGVERFLMWVLHHDDIRDMTLVSRIGESDSWPDAVVRP